MASKNTARDWAKQTIQSVGLRATPARIATLLVIRDSLAPLSHGEVSADLEDQGIDRATVFRNLNDMVAANLLRRSQLGDHVWRFEFITAEDHDNASRPRFVCIDCGSVASMEEVELSKKSKSVSKRFGQITEILLRGHCPDCV